MWRRPVTTPHHPSFTRFVQTVSVGCWVQRTFLPHLLNETRPLRSPRAVALPTAIPKAGPRRAELTPGALACGLHEAGAAAAPAGLPEPARLL